MTATLAAAATILLTYAAHSAGACGIALALRRLLRRPHDRDVLWKLALVAPILTTAIALAMRTTHPAGSIDLANGIRAIAGQPLGGREVMVSLTKINGAAHVTRRIDDPVAAALSVVVLLVAAIAVAVAGVRAVVRWRARSARLEARVRREVGAIEHVSLSTCDDLPSPVAVGRSEICLPTRVLDEFDERQRAALIAHEMAHLRRRDPLWFGIVDAVVAVSAFQPLVVRVARAVRRDVELICDESAVRRTGDRVALIGALALLAEPFDSAAPLGAVSAYDGGPLVERAEAIARVDEVASRAATRRTALVAAIVLATALLALPVVGPAENIEDLPLDPTKAAARSPHDERVVVVDSAGRRLLHRDRIVLIRE
jgi:beta-lactamase regulating signal transducer with metallopeptidase domain